MAACEDIGDKEGDGVLKSTPRPSQIRRGFSTEHCISFHNELFILEDFALNCFLINNSSSIDLVNCIIEHGNMKSFYNGC